MNSGVSQVFIDPHLVVLITMPEIQFIPILKLISSIKLLHYCTKNRLSENDKLIFSNHTLLVAKN